MYVFNTASPWRCKVHPGSGAQTDLPRTRQRWKASPDLYPGPGGFVALSLPRYVSLTQPLPAGERKGFRSSDAARRLLQRSRGSLIFFPLISCLLPRTTQGTEPRKLSFLFNESSSFYSHLLARALSVPLLRYLEKCIFDNSSVRSPTGFRASAGDY